MLAQLSGVRYRPPGAERDALAGIDLELGAGELVLLAGPSGSGKTTLLRTLCGLVPALPRWSLRRHVHGRGPRHAARANRPRSVRARASSSRIPRPARSCSRSTARSRSRSSAPPGRRREIATRVAEALDEAGAGHLRARATSELSGGELQRVALAAALAGRPPLLLLDEPMSQLDPAAASALALRLRALADAGACVVVTEHRIERIASHADRIVRMEAGRIVADGPATDDLVPHTEAAPARSGDTLASLSAITAGYPGRPVLNGRCARARSGQVTALAGENGSGKSTLARVLAGLHAPDAGSVQLEGEDVTAFPIERRFPRVAFVSQDPGRVLLRERVDDEVGFGPGQLGWPADERRRAVAAALEAVGLEAARRASPSRSLGRRARARRRRRGARVASTRARARRADARDGRRDEHASRRAAAGACRRTATPRSSSRTTSRSAGAPPSPADVDRRRPVLTRALWPLLALVLGALALTLGARRAVGSLGDARRARARRARHRRLGARAGRGARGRARRQLRGGRGGRARALRRDPERPARDDDDRVRRRRARPTRGCRRRRRSPR